MLITSSRTTIGINDLPLERIARDVSYLILYYHSETSVFVSICWWNRKALMICQFDDTDIGITVLLGINFESSFRKVLNVLLLRTKMSYLFRKSKCIGTFLVYFVLTVIITFFSFNPHPQEYNSWGRGRMVTLNRGQGPHPSPPWMTLTAPSLGSHPLPTRKYDILWQSHGQLS